MRPPFFFFGTLRDADIFRAVIGRPMAAFATAPASLDGHAVERLAEWPYPRLVVRDGALARGLLVDGFTAAEVDRMCFFESEEYEMRQIEVRTSTGPRAVACFIADERMESSALAWSLDDWRRLAKDRALAETEICMTEYFGRVSRRDLDRQWPEIERRAAESLAGRQTPSALAS